MQANRGVVLRWLPAKCVTSRSVAPEAAREIKSLIEDSVGRVELGSTLVESAGETMDEIVNAVTRVTDIMGEIASASDEQSRGIDRWVWRLPRWIA